MKDDLASDVAMVLAAGLGLRMRPLTLDKPKPLVEVAGRPMIDHCLDKLAAAGIARAVVNVHYLPDLLITHLRDRERPKVTISDERDLLLETGGGMIRALPLIEPHEGVLIGLPDTIWFPEDALRALPDDVLAFLLFPVERSIRTICSSTGRRTSSTS